MLKRLLFLCILFPSFLFAESTNNNFPSDAVTEVVTQFMQANNVPGVAVELIQDGKAKSYYFGYANQEKKIPVNQNTIFEVGSLTKLMTSLLLAQEIDVAKMQLTDPVTQFIKNLPPSFEKVTLQDLATHTAGLPFDAPKNIKNLDQLEQYFASWDFKPTVQDKWAYSNFGIGVLGYAIENVTQKKFNQLFKSEILKPLGMEPIALTVPSRFKKRYAQGYDANGKPVKEVSSGLFPSAYAVKVSANDMQRFLSAAIGLPGTPATILYPMRMTQTAYVELQDSFQGLGWQLHPNPFERTADLLKVAEIAALKPRKVIDVFDKPVFNGNMLMDKTGMTNGFRAYIAVIPNKKTGIVILANRSLPNNDIVKLGREILFANDKSKG